MNPDAFKILTGTKTSIGLTWYAMTGPNPNFVNTPKFINGASYNDITVAVGSGGNAIGDCSIAITSNAANSNEKPFKWQAIPAIASDTGIPGVSTNYTLIDAVFDDVRNNFLLVGKNCYVILTPASLAATLYKTSVAMSTADPLFLNTVKFSGGNFYAVGSGGGIFIGSRTAINVDNGGYAWNKRSSQSTDNLLDIDTSTGTFIAVGGYSFLRSDDWGLTWVNQYSIKIQPLQDTFGMSIRGLHKIFYCGVSTWLLAAQDQNNAAILLLSTNNGDSWIYLDDFSKKSVFYSAKIKNIFRLRGLTYVINDSGQLFMSDDLVKWTLVNNLYSGFYKDCIILDRVKSKMFALSNNSYSVSM